MKYFFSFLLAGVFFYNLTAQSNYETGYAIYYADYLNGRQTASGEVFSQQELTCAHKTHPFGTLLKVTRQDNDMSVIVRVNDRGTFCEGCVVDISRIAAERLDLIKAGKKMVNVQVVGFSRTNPKVLSTWSDVTGRDPVSYDNAPRKIIATPRDKLVAKGETSPANTQVTPQPRQAQQVPKESPRTYSAPPAVNNVATTQETEAVKYLPLGQTGYFIQLGAYTLESNAQRTLVDLQRKGMKYLYLQKGSTRPNESVTRMFLGPFKTQYEANNYLRDTCPKFGVTGIVVLLN
ncbi:MAG: septal ring lytic transglycosylase RlpA family protein [Saprospiraceae bacterium]|nr:septal ring lytic transglycosylase RlpA family protein [Saprospiraceae bacterium]MCB9325701.1 septal ring lytic transglycosylase RlpA family protein [Lewinellaceae bacterium]